MGIVRGDMSQNLEEAIQRIKQALPCQCENQLDCIACDIQNGYENVWNDIRRAERMIAEKKGKTFLTRWTWKAKVV